jgi:hypothetical protein
MHATEPLESCFHVEIVLGKPKRYKLPAIDQIPAEMNEARSDTLRFEISRIINTILNMEELPQQWKETIITPILKGAIVIEGYQRYQLHTESYRILLPQA